MKNKLHLTVIFLILALVCSEIIYWMQRHEIRKLERMLNDCLWHDATNQPPQHAPGDGMIVITARMVSVTLSNPPVTKLQMSFDGTNWSDYAEIPLTSSNQMMWKTNLPADAIHGHDYIRWVTVLTAIATNQ